MRSLSSSSAMTFFAINLENQITVIMVYQNQVDACISMEQEMDFVSILTNRV